MEYVSKCKKWILTTYTHIYEYAPSLLTDGTKHLVLKKTEVRDCGFMVGGKSLVWDDGTAVKYFEVPDFEKYLLGKVSCIGCSIPRKRKEKKDLMDEYELLTREEPLLQSYDCGWAEVRVHENKMFVVGSSSRDVCIYDRYDKKPSIMKDIRLEEKHRIIILYYRDYNDVDNSIYLTDYRDKVRSLENQMKWIDEDIKEIEEEIEGINNVLTYINSSVAVLE